MSSGQQDDTVAIACQQVLLRDASVFSIQWLVFHQRHADLLTPGYLLTRYLAHLRRCTLSLIRPLMVDAGIEFRFGNSGLSLLTFTGPVYESTAAQNRATLRISGGILVQPRQCDRGQLLFSTEPVTEGIRVTLELSEFCPLILGGRTPSRLRKLVYRITQAYIHKAVTINYLARLYREIEGPKMAVRVVRVAVEQGEET